MNKRIKRVLALLLACTIVIGSVNNARLEARASAAGIIAGGGAAVVGVEVAFPYLLAITGVVAAGVGVYKNRDKIKEWGSAQFGKFKKWVGDNLEELGWAADAAVAGTAIAKWGDKLSSGTLDKSDPTWNAYKKWLEEDVYTTSGSEGTLMYNGYPWTGKNTAVQMTNRVDVSNSKDYGIYMVSASDCLWYIAVTDSAGGVFKEFDGEGGSLVNWCAVVMTEKYNGVTYKFVAKAENIGMENASNVIGIYDRVLTMNEVVKMAVEVFADGVDISKDDGEKEYSYVGGLSGVIGRPDILNPSRNWDVVGVDEKEGEKETKLPWVQDPTLDDLLDGVQTGEKTWSDVLEETQTGVIDRTEEGDMVIDEDGVTTKEWTYADTDATTPDITLPDTSTETPSKELSNYTFAGLEKIFPFCLPFDAMDFIKVLEAEPQAPHFTFPIKYPTGNGWATYDIDIDLSPFDTAAEILRDMECLLFIVGLIMVTRSQMIRG